MIGFDDTDEGLTVTIDTENLRLTSIKEADVDLHYALLYSDPKVMEKFMTGTPFTKEKVQHNVATSVGRWKLKNPFSSFTVTKHENDEFVGDVTLKDGENPGEAELGYIIAEKHWGKGIATEAVTPIVNLYANELAIRKYEANGQPFTTLYATARTDNVASVKILEKVGMTLEKQEEKFGAMRNHYRRRFP